MSCLFTFAGASGARFAQLLEAAQRFVRKVTSSSAALGCKAMVRSKSALVALRLSAIAAICTISAASGPSMCTPSTWPLVRIHHELHVRALITAGKHVAHRPEPRFVNVHLRRTCARRLFRQPTVPISGVVNTAVGMFS